MGDGTLFLGGWSEVSSGSILMAAAWGGEGEKGREDFMTWYKEGLRGMLPSSWKPERAWPWPGREE